MIPFSIGGLQIGSPYSDKINYLVAEISAAAKRYPWLDMIVAPELAGCGTDSADAEPMPGPAEKALQAVAKEHGIWLVPGSLFESDGDVVYNTVPVINPDGDVVARYRKQFPWMPYETGTTAGDTPVVFDVPGVGRFGISNCYDMWFPETLRTLTSLGAEVILHPSLTSSIDRVAEHSIIRASAAIYQCYFFDVNLAPSIGVGQSLIAGPGGETIYEAGREREVIPLRLDLDYVRDVRENGWQGLGQTLKSYRDSQIEFPQYNNGNATEYLDSLGTLKMPTSNFRKHATSK